jgi:hypothetical protein
VNLGFAPTFFGRSDRRHRIADAVPSVVELAKLHICGSQQRQVK